MQQRSVSTRSSEVANGIGQLKLRARKKFESAEHIRNVGDFSRLFGELDSSPENGALEIRWPMFAIQAVITQMLKDD